MHLVLQREFERRLKKVNYLNQASFEKGSYNYQRRGYIQKVSIHTMKFFNLHNCCNNYDVNTVSTILEEPHSGTFPPLFKQTINKLFHKKSSLLHEGILSKMFIFLINVSVP